MRNIIQINGEWLPAPDGNLEITPTKVKTKKETESGKSVIIVTRPTKLTISGEWTLSGSWAKKFRAYREADTVQVGVYYPDPMNLSTYECEFEITSDDQDPGSRKQLVKVGALYKLGAEMTEI